MRLIIPTCIFLITGILTGFSQEGSDQTFNEDQIEELCFGVLNADNDSERKQFNQSLLRLLKDELQKPHAFSYPFSKVKSLGIYTSPDSVIRVFNWMVPFNDGSYKYECLVMIQESSDIHLTELIDSDFDSIPSEEAIRNAEKWPGALYYELIQKQSDSKTYYTLLGWDGDSRLTNKKIIDVFSVSNSGELIIGAPIFELNGNLRSRRVFTFSGQHSMKLNYNEELDQIQFDFLAPLRPDLEGVYEYYFPAVTQDAYRWENDHWKFVNLIDTDEGHKRDKKRLEKQKKEVIKEQGIIYSPK